MKIYQNVLSDSLIKECISDMNRKLHTQSWSSSNFVWAPNIKIGVQGSSLQCKITDDLSTRIQNELRHLLPKHDFVVCQYYMWQAGSGISKHNDSKHEFGATIYLDRKWDPNWGGCFLYWEKGNDSEAVKGVFPRYNQMILNDDVEFHMVTPISPNETRSTIQVWGKKKG